MNICENIETRIAYCQSQLDIIDRTISEEMSRGYGKRRPRYLRFLHAEKQAYSLTLSELNAVLRGADAQDKTSGSPAFELDRRASSNNARENKRQMPQVNKRTYRIVASGGAGDALLITPTLRALKQSYPECRIYVYCIDENHEAVLKNNRYIDRLMLAGLRRRVLFFLLSKLNLITRQPFDDEYSQTGGLYRRLGTANIHDLNYAFLSPSLFYRKSAAAIIGEMMGIEIDDPRPNCFLTESEEIEGRQIVSKYSNPVAIQVNGKCSSNKNWPVARWEELILNNPDYNFLQLGLASEDLIKGAVDLRGTTLRQAFAIIKAVKAFIGVDSVFAHAATALQTPAVVLFGPSTPMLWGYAENQNLYCAPRCSPCLDTLGKDPCPYGLPCMFNITVSDVENALSLSLKQSTGRADRSEMDKSRTPVNLLS